MDATKSKSRIFVLGHTKSASSLLKKTLEKHPQLDILDDSFQEAYTHGPEKLQRVDHGDAHYSEARKEASSNETYQKAFDRLHKSITRAEQQGKRPLFTEDAYVIFRPDVTSATVDLPTPVIMTSKAMPTNFRSTFPIFHPITEGLGIHTIESRPPKANPTVLPDAFLKTMTPICLIQHPARTFPSLYRAAHLNAHGSEFPIVASLRWCKLLVDWYTDTAGTKPIVLDEADLIHEPAIIAKLCQALSLDTSGVQTSYNTISQAGTREQDAMTPAMMATTQTSEEVEYSRKRDDEIDIDEEAEGWKKEFGVAAADTIKGFVMAAMDDYSSLRQRTIK